MCSPPQELTEPIEWFLDYLAVEKAASRNTVDAYHRDLMQAAKLYFDAGQVDWAAFCPDDADRFYAWMAGQGLSQTSVRRKLSALRSFLKFLLREGYDVRSRLPEHTSARKPRRLPKALTEREVEALLAVPDASRAPGLRDRAMLESLYGCGLRVSECCDLVISDLLLQDEVVRVTGKRGKTRIIPIPQGTLMWLVRYLKDGRPALVKPKSPSRVFLNQRGGGLSRSGVFRILQGHARKAGIRKAVGPHTLRHSYAVHLVRAGADLRAVQELLGHESVATTEVYTFLDFDTLREKYRQAHPRATGDDEPRGK